MARDGIDDGNPLGSFLRSRRERVDAASAGVGDHTRRRVKGLRREELALLAGVSPSYYARLEQGRDRHPSREILEALAGVLRLDDAERAYLWALVAPSLQPAGPASAAGAAGGAGAAAVPAAAGTVRPGALLLLERAADLPAFVVDPRREVLAATALAGRINPAWRVGRNLVEFAFLDPQAGEVYPDRAEIARQAVAGLRTTAAARPGELDGFVAGLRERSGEFRALWDSRDVYARTAGAKRIAAGGGAGVLTLEFETLALGGPEGHVLYVYFGAAGSADEAALRALAAPAD